MSKQQLQRVVEMIRAAPVKVDPTLEEEREDYEPPGLPGPVDIRTQPVTTHGVEAESLDEGQQAIDRIGEFIRAKNALTDAVSSHGRL